MIIMYKLNIKNVKVETEKGFKFNDVRLMKTSFMERLTATDNLNALSRENTRHVNDFLRQLTDGKDGKQTIDKLGALGLLSEKFQTYVESNRYMIETEKKLKDKFIAQVKAAAKRQLIKDFNSEIENGSTYEHILNNYYTSSYSVALQPLENDSDKKKIRLIESDEKLKHDIAMVKVTYQIVKA